MPTINPKGLAQRPTAYNHAVIRPGTPVFLTGQVAWNASGEIVGVGEIEAQVRQTYANIQCILDDLKATPANIVKIVVYATDRSFKVAHSKIRQEFFAGFTLPASTFLVVDGLTEPELLIEIDATLMI